MLKEENGAMKKVAREKNPQAHQEQYNSKFSDWACFVQICWRTALSAFLTLNSSHSIVPIELRLEKMEFFLSN